MIINDCPRIAYATQLQDFLQENAGEHYTLRALAKQLGIGESSAKEELTRLIVLGRVRKNTSFSAARYYVPDAETLKKEQEGLKSRFQPLKPRMQHREAVEKAIAARSAFKSVY